MAKSPINVVPKVFHDLSALKEPPQTDLENDGFILYNREKNYKHPIFKMKNDNQNTCDLLVYNKEGVLWFCIAVTPERIDNLFYDQAKELKGIGKRCFPNRNLQVVQFQVVGSPNISSRKFTQCQFSGEEVKTAVKNDQSFAIIECLWVEQDKTWRLIKLRSDKTFPNSALNCVNNFVLSKDPITFEQLKTQQVSFYSEKEDDTYGEFNYLVSKLIHNYITGTAKVHFGSEVEVLTDMACGRGGRLRVLSEIKVAKEDVFLDISQSSIEEVKARLATYKGKCVKKRQLFVFHWRLYKRKRRKSHDRRHVKKNPVLIETKSSFVFMIYAVHYMFKNKESFVNFAKLLNFCTKEGSVFVTNIICADTAHVVNNKKYLFDSIEPQTPHVAFGNFGNIVIPFGEKGRILTNLEPIVYVTPFIEEMKNIGWQVIDQKNMAKIKRFTTFEDKLVEDWLGHHKFFTFKRVR